MSQDRTLFSQHPEGENDPLVCLQAGFELHQAGKIEEALAYYHQALEQDPKNPDALYLAGVAYFQGQDFDQAESLLEAALALDPGRSDILINLGNCQHAKNRLDKAAAAFTQAIAADPGIPEAHNNLGNILKELGRLDEAEAAFREALTLNPDYLSAMCNLASTLRGLSRLEEAEAMVRQALALEPAHDMALTTLGSILRDQKRPEEARTALEQAIKLDPVAVESYEALAGLLRQQGETGEALKICDAYLQIEPRGTSILATKALLLNEHGGPEAAKSHLDFKRFVLPLRFDQAPGYDSMASFHTALSGYVGQHPRLKYEPHLKSTQQGFQAENLQFDEALPVDTLKDMIAQGVEQYCALCEQELGHTHKHPLAPPPDDLTINIWVTILEANGYQQPHIHPSAWLSGVYYVALPKIMKTDLESKAGWIEFGRPPDDLNYQAEPLVHAIQPEEGLMVLFSSYIYHRTIPIAEAAASTGAEKRISIAFDVIAN